MLLEDGGNVNITTQGIFGIAFRDRLTPLSDITASSEFGLAGNVTINTLNIDPIRGTVELPTTFSTPPIAQGCQAQGSQAGSFVSTGRGGLPASPTDPLAEDTIWQDWDLLAGESQKRRDAASGSQDSHPHPPPPPSIIEAQGWTTLVDGTIALTAQALSVAPQLLNNEGKKCVPVLQPVSH